MSIQTFNDLYLEIAKLANKKGNRKLLITCLQNRKRILIKEMTTATAAAHTDEPIES